MNVNAKERQYTWVARVKRERLTVTRGRESWLCEHATAENMEARSK